MSANIPFTRKEMQIINAIHAINPNAQISIKSQIKNRLDYKYGGIVFLNCDAMTWDEVQNKIDEQEEKRLY